jgi:hypothetical protein
MFSKKGGAAMFLAVDFEGEATIPLSMKEFPKKYLRALCRPLFSLFCSLFLNVFIFSC